jgi:hypothetical protein
MAPEGRFLAVSVHDVAPATWDRCQRVLDAVRAVADIPLTLLAVPAYHGKCSAQPRFEMQLTERLAAGDELALHGYFHCDPQSPCGLADWLRRRVYTVEGEFAGLCEREAAERIHLGQRWFAANGWPPAALRTSPAMWAAWAGSSTQKKAALTTPQLPALSMAWRYTVWRPLPRAPVGTVARTCSTVLLNWPSTATIAIGVAPGDHGGMSTKSWAPAIGWVGSPAPAW